MPPWQFDEVLFHVALRVVHPTLPHLAVSGALRKEPSGSSTLALQIDTPDGHQIDADCSGNVRQLFPGAAWFELSACAPSNGAFLGCSIDVTVIVEGCDR